MSKLNQSAKNNRKKLITNSSKTKETKTKNKTLGDLFKEELKNIYSAEIQLVQALPKIAKACYSEDLQEAITDHLQQTKRHVERLEKAFTRLGIDKSDVERCRAMEGLIEEGNKIIEEFEESPVRDSALIIGSQKIEHYEIAAYGSLCELCDVLGLHQLGDILGRSLDEEERTDKNLSEIAQIINDEAYESGEHMKEGSTKRTKSGSYVNKNGQLKSYNKHR